MIGPLGQFFTACRLDLALAVIVEGPGPAAAETVVDIVPRFRVKGVGPVGMSPMFESCFLDIPGSGEDSISTTPDVFLCSTSIFSVPA